MRRQSPHARCLSLRRPSPANLKRYFALSNSLHHKVWEFGTHATHIDARSNMLRPDSYTACGARLVAGDRSVGAVSTGASHGSDFLVRYMGPSWSVSIRFPVFRLRETQSRSYRGAEFLAALSPAHCVRRARFCAQQTTRRASIACPGP